AGWDSRTAWVANEGSRPASFTFEVDKKGDGNWSVLKTIGLAAGASADLAFASGEQGEWIRVVAASATTATVHFSYTDHGRFSRGGNPIFDGLARVDEGTSATGGLLYGLGDNRRALGVLASSIDSGG